MRQPDQGDGPDGASQYAHRLRNLALAVRLAADLLEPESLAVRRIFAAADGLFELADDMDADGRGAS